MHQNIAYEISYDEDNSSSEGQVQNEITSETPFQPIKISTGVKDDSVKALKAAQKVIKQLPNMYKNTRMSKYLLESGVMPFRVEYKKIKGLMLNIAKRLSWYMDLEEEEIKCLLISVKARSSKVDVSTEERSDGFFEYYAKAIFNINGEMKFIVVPLYNLNIRVI